MTTPTTAAGRALWAEVTDSIEAGGGLHVTAEDILAIEAEAIAAERARIAAKVEGMFGQFHPMCAVESEPTRHDVVSRKYVLAIVKEPQP